MLEQGAFFGRSLSVFRIIKFQSKLFACGFPESIVARLGGTRPKKNTLETVNPYVSRTSGHGKLLGEP